MKDVKPLMLRDLAPPRPLRDSLATVPSGEVTSPWTPRRTEAVPAPVEPVVHQPLEVIQAQARERGRAEGLAETAAARAALATLITRVEAANARIQALAGTQIAEAVVAVIAAWTGSAPRAELFAPVIRAWLGTGSAGARPRVCVHPGDVEAVRAALGETAAEVSVDPTMSPGDIALRTETLELVNRWDERLADLREQVAMWIEHEGMQ